jgi:hypothetical protein
MDTAPRYGSLPWRTIAFVAKLRKCVWYLSQNAKVPVGLYGSGNQNAIVIIVTTWALRKPDARNSKWQTVVCGMLQVERPIADFTTFPYREVHQFRFTTA